ncbi:Methyl-accepting chemotaxis protein [Marinospirillum celere]|uniref:Methyl-accepting chemotaxis protein n=1 Tax=Marinospirillum celere TaxID=1122252 RepID=A0A1I1HZ99_9GAMM|nr:methyl-accepting chemotaxis protein [Marinospirillum celere]SFC29161.1 Methyl-accepting chemotaxis protein [Marinospirillum celere]
MLSFVRNISIRYKLLLLVVPPLVGMLAYAGLSTRNDLQLFSSLQEQQQLAEARQQLSQAFSSYNQVRQQVIQGQEVTADLSRALQRLSEESAELPSEIRATLNDLDGLAQELVNSEPELETLLDPEASLNKLAQRLELFSTQLSGQAGGITTRWHSSHHALMQAISRLHEEQLLLTLAFEATYFPEGAYPRFIRLLSEQNVFLNSYNNHLQDAPDLRLDTWLDSDTYRQIEEIRAMSEQIYLDGNFGLSTPSDEWQALTAELLERPEALQDEVLDTLLMRVENELASARQRLLIISSSNIFLVLLGILIAWFIYRQISIPTLQLTRSMEAVAKDLDLTRQLAVVGKDETAQVAKAFDQMLSQVRKLLQEVISATDEVATSSNLGKRVANNLETQVGQGMQSLEAMLSSVEELHAAINEVAHNAESSQDASQNASRLAANGSELVNNLQSHNQSLEESLKASGNKVTELAEHSAKIDNILEVINDIAEQTNLLALNAAIEAARAGDAGRGFAVVADEVRSLAARSREATVEISQLLESNRLAAQEAVDRMQSSLSQADEVSHYLTQAGQSLQEINAAVEGIHQANVETASAANQQNTAVEHLSESANLMHQLYQETSKEVEELENNSSSLEKLLQGLEKQLKRFTT